MPTIALQSFFGWNLDLTGPPPLGPTNPSYAAWQASVITFSLLWLLLAPGTAPIARLALAYLQLGFTAGDWDVDDAADRRPADEVTTCVATV